MKDVRDRDRSDEERDMKPEDEDRQGMFRISSGLR